jgi:hypothetical protein
VRLFGTLNEISLRQSAWFSHIQSDYWQDTLNTDYACCANLPVRCLLQAGCSATSVGRTTSAPRSCTWFARGTEWEHAAAVEVTCGTRWTEFATWSMSIRSIMVCSYGHVSLSKRLKHTLRCFYFAWKCHLPFPPQFHRPCDRSDEWAMFSS